ncbi:hypothetical protein LPUS_06391 [Lasallia pustulata]|nr:hypothetical protein LPUS_06391 [Lasallia pustulata]
MNRIRIKHEAVREAARKQIEFGRQLPLPPRLSPAQKPHRQYIPLSPSPLGLSNYDALDQEGDPCSEDEHGTAEVSSIYSDFNVLDSSEPVLDDYDSLTSFDDPIIEYEDICQQRPPTPPREEIIKLAMEIER